MRQKSETGSLTVERTRKFVVNLHAIKLRLVFVERRFRYFVLAADFDHLQAVLLHYPDDLFGRKP